MRITYEGADITEDVSVVRCWHDMHAWGAMDSLTMELSDTRNLWDAWGPRQGDAVEVTDGAARTGKMLVSSVVPRSSGMTITAYPVPQSARERRCKSWERVHLLQLVAEVAGRHGLAWESYGIDNYEYSYVEQDNETDMAFLDRRLTYEGASMVVFDGKLVAYSGQWVEEQGATGTLEVVPGVDYEFRDESAQMYGSCEVTDGSTRGEFSASDGKRLLRVIPERMSGAAEAERFAKGVLRAANREAARMTVRTDSMLRGYAAGSVVDLQASAAGSWSGDAVIYMMRQDYARTRSKVCLARPLGGY